MLMGWIGIVGIICASAINTGYGVLGFLKDSGLTIFFTFSWLLFLVGAIGCIYHMYIKHLVDQLDVEKVSTSKFDGNKERM